jgi:CysZ protein
VAAGLLIALGALTVLKALLQTALAPFMSMLSEQVEARLTGAQAPSPGLAGILSDIWRGLRIALRNLWRELLYVLGLTLLGMLIPGIGSVLATAAVFAVQAYYAGFGNLDYTLERHRYPVADSVRFVRAHRGLAMGNGAVFLLLLIIPVAGLFVAPVLGTVAATLGILDLQDRKR